MSDSRLRSLLLKVTAKRPRTVLEHILKHGQVTTDELKTLYGYNHPPRAARDVRELGIPLETTTVEGPDGRKIAAYKLGNLDALESGKQGRRSFPKALKDELGTRDGERCTLCGVALPLRALQIDHRVPFEIAGDANTSEQLDPSEFMLLCGSCNRSKSWSCEHCPNWTAKRPSVCTNCFWSGEPNYSHIATSARRQLTLNWKDEEVGHFDQLRAEAKRRGVPLEEVIKALLKKGGKS
jgi:hypothetical protein